MLKLIHTLQVHLVVTGPSNRHLCIEIVFTFPTSEHVTPG